MPLLPPFIPPKLPLFIRLTLGEWEAPLLIALVAVTLLALRVRPGGLLVAEVAALGPVVPLAKALREVPLEIAFAAAFAKELAWGLLPWTLAW